MGGGGQEGVAIDLLGEDGIWAAQGHHCREMPVILFLATQEGYRSIFRKIMAYKYSDHDHMEYWKDTKDLSEFRLHFCDCLDQNKPQIPLGH